MFERFKDYCKVGDFITFWLEQESSIHLKAIGPEGQGVRISKEDARAMSEELIKMADFLEADSE